MFVAIINSIGPTGTSGQGEGVSRAKGSFTILAILGLNWLPPGLTEFIILFMARTWRGSVGGYCYHVRNRGNKRACVFPEDVAYDSFVRLFREACTHVAMRIIGYCLMPNHIHLVL